MTFRTWVGLLQHQQSYKKRTELQRVFYNPWEMHACVSVICSCFPGSLKHRIRQLYFACSDYREHRPVVTAFAVRGLYSRKSTLEVTSPRLLVTGQITLITCEVQIRR